MSSFGHRRGFINNPTFEHDGDCFEDPVHTAAGKVLEQYRISVGDNSLQSFGEESGKPASGLSGIAKFLLVLVLLASLSAIVLCLLLATGTINTSNGSSNQQDGSDSVKIGFHFSNKQLYDMIIELQEKIEALQKANVTTRERLERLQVQGNKEERDINRLQKALNDTIDKCEASDFNLPCLQITTRLAAQEAKEQADVHRLQKAINDTTDKCEAGDNTITTRLAAQEAKEQDDVQRLEKALNDTTDKCEAGDNTITTKLAAQEAKEQADVNWLQKALNDTTDKCEAGDNTITTRLAAQEAKENSDVSKLNDTIIQLIAADTTIVMDLQTVNSTLLAKIEKVSKMEGPKGPRGNNGSQGIQGPQGPQGAQGDRGPRGYNGTLAMGDLTQCEVIRKASTPITAKDVATISVNTVEQTGKKILSVSCSSNIADTAEQDVGVNSSGQIAFSCTCTGRGSYTGFSGSNMICYLTYTECTLT